MEIGHHFVSCRDPHVLWQHGVQGPPELDERPARWNTYSGGLAKGVNSGIGPARAEDRNV
jgi:hypothetical protein